MRSLRLSALAAVIGTALCGVSSAPATPAIVEIGVTFSVVNTNTTSSAAICAPDGKTYAVRGTLAGPADALQDGPDDSVALYVHGSGDGSTWNFPGFPGVNHIAEMAALGHISVFIHMLGYGTSDAINGSDMCFGSYPDVAQQVVQHLRAGTFEASGHPMPAFERVSLVGHSLGAFVAEVYSVTYDDIDALVLVGWADIAPASWPFYTELAGFAVACGKGGRSKPPGGPGGWARVFDDETIHRFLYNVAPEVEAAFLELYEDDFCGFVDDSGPLLVSSFALAPLQVEVPILLLYGDHDPFRPDPLDIQRARYLSSDDVTLGILPNSGHNLMMGRTAVAFREVLSSWLRARGF